MLKTKELHRLNKGDTIVVAGQGFKVSSLVARGHNMFDVYTRVSSTVEANICTVPLNTVFNVREK